MGGSSKTASALGYRALCLASSLSGCQLIGYEGYTLRESELDASFDLDATLRDTGAADPGTADTGTTDAADAKRASDGSDAATGDAAQDASCVPNACGGCATLANAPGESCGGCGLGRYACEGTALVCSGGDALPKATSGVQLLDDFEDGDDVPKAGWGADGYWFVYTDHSAGHIDPTDGSRIIPVFDGAAGTQRSAHIKGGGFTEFGAGLILWPNAKQCAFDVSNQRGLGFWIKGSAKLWFSAATVHTVDPKYCASIGCNDFHAMSFALTKTWTHYTLQWSDLKQAGWGAPATFDPSELLYLQFSFERNVDFELYLDELGFY